MASLDAVDSADPVEHCPFMPVFAPPQVMFRSGEGAILHDVDGKRYIDLLGGIAVISLGHSHPAVSDAIREQSRKLMHVSNLFANERAGEAATAVNALLEAGGAGPGQVFFCNSGAEAVEAAIKLARRFGGRGRHAVVSAHGSFHGRTLGALAATGQPAKQEPFAPMPEGFRSVGYGDIGALAAAVDGSVAAVLLEPIQGEGGVVVAPSGYLRDAARICRDAGALLMLDEVQTGFSRTGRWFAFEHEDVRPDVVMMAKGMGNGFPVGALWARREIAAAFRPGDHGSTFSGSALATAVVATVIKEMKRIDAPRLAAEKGDRFRSRLSTCSVVEGIRGRGLLLGIEMGGGLDAKAITQRLLDRGVVVNAVSGSVLRLAPPLTIEDELIDEAAQVIVAELERAAEK